MASNSKSDPWLNLKKRIISKDNKDTDKSKGSKEMWDNAAPELIIQFCRHSLGSFGKLKTKLSNCDSDWIEGFLDHNGLLFIFECLEALSKSGLGHFLDAVKQLECISCLRAVMNNRSGLEYIIKSDQFQKVFAEQISRSMDTENVLLKSHIVELLCAISLYSFEGYETTMDTLVNVQLVRGLPYTFSSVMNEIQRAHRAEQISYLATLLSFVNVLIVSLEDIDERNETRQEFVTLGIANLLDELRFTGKEELKSQIDAYHQSAQQDLEQNFEYNANNEIDIESEEALIKLMSTKLKGTTSFDHFLHIIQSLYIIENSMTASNNEQKWRSLDHALCSLIVNSIDSNEMNELDERTLMKKTLKESVSQIRLKPELVKDEELIIQVEPINPMKFEKKPETVNKEVQTDKILIETIEVSTVSETAIDKAKLPVEKKDKVQEIPEGYVFPDPPPDLPEVEASKPKIPDLPPDLPEVEAAKPKIPKPPPNLPGVITDDDNEDNDGSSDPRIPKPPPNLPVVESTDCENSKIPKPPPNIPGVQGAEAKGDTKQIHVPVLKPSKKLRTLQWDKFSDKDVKTKQLSLWKNIKLSQLSLDSKFIKIVEEDYCVKEVVKSATQKSNKNEKITFFDQRAGMNICIFLKQFKKPSLTDIIREGDVHVISLEQTKAFAKILPENSVVKQLREYDDALNKLNEADYFFKEFVKLENYDLRIQMLNTKLEYFGEYHELDPNLDKLDKACTEILGNTLLNKVLELVLTLGNFINYGSHAGSAAGFRVSSLTKLKDTRANKPRMTLMNSIVDIAEDRSPELLKLAASMPTLESALRLSSDQLSDAVKVIDKKIEQMQAKTLKAATDLNEQVTSFLQVAQPQIAELKKKAIRVTKMSSEICQFFAEDPKTYKLEDFMKVLFQFTNDFDRAVNQNIKRREDEARKERISEKQKALSQKKPNLGKLGVQSTKTDDCDIIEKLMGEIKNGMTLKSFSEVRGSTICEDETTRKNSVLSNLSPTQLATTQRVRKKTTYRINTHASMKKVSVGSISTTSSTKADYKEEEKHTSPLNISNPVIHKEVIRESSQEVKTEVTPVIVSSNTELEIISQEQPKDEQSRVDYISITVNESQNLDIRQEMISPDPPHLDDYSDKTTALENGIRTNDAADDKLVESGINNVQAAEPVLNTASTESIKEGKSIKQAKKKDPSPSKLKFWHGRKKTNKSPS